MAWFREHRAVDGRIVQQEAVQAVRDQYGIPAGLLFGDGDDSGGLGKLNANAPSLRGSAGTPGIWRKSIQRLRQLPPKARRYAYRQRPCPDVPREPGRR